MKLRAIIQDQQFMKEFLSIIVTLSKLSKDCTMNIGFDEVYFIANEDSGCSAPMVWVEIKSRLYFTEFMMEGVNEKYPYIMLSISTSNFARALSHLRSSAKYCKIKLTNIQFPCLTIEMEVINNMSEHPRQIVHNVPVSIIPRAEWNEYALPRIPKSNLTLNVPWNRTMRSFIDKMKNISPTILFYASSDCELNLVVETNLATITTSYKNLILNEQNSNDCNDKGSIEASCSVDCKKASILFSSLQIPVYDMLFGIRNNHLIHISSSVREGVVLHSILPAVTI